MVRDDDWPISIFLALRHIRKHRGQQIGGTGTLYLKWNLLAVPVPEQGQSAVRVPAPTRFQQWREQRRLLQNFFHRVLMQEVKNIGQRKAVLLSQRNVYAIVCCGCLQLKVERDAEALAQGESPGFVDARAERRMHH